MGIPNAKAIFTSTVFPYLLCNIETAFLFVWSTCPRACFFAAIFIRVLVSIPSATTHTHVTVLCSYIDIHARACQRSVLHTKEFYRYFFCECFPRDCEGTWKAITANKVKMRQIYSVGIPLCFRGGRWQNWQRWALQIRTTTDWYWMRLTARNHDWTDCCVRRRACVRGCACVHVSKLGAWHVCEHKCELDDISLSYINLRDWHCAAYIRLTLRSTCKIWLLTIFHVRHAAQVFPHMHAYKSSKLSHIWWTWICTDVRTHVLICDKYPESGGW